MQYQYQRREEEWGGRRGEILRASKMFASPLTRNEQINVLSDGPGLVRTPVSCSSRDGIVDRSQVDRKNRMLL